jgi:hypothetical protein
MSINSKKNKSKLQTYINIFLIGHDVQIYRRKMNRLGDEGATEFNAYFGDF